MFEIEYTNHTMAISYERGKMLFFVEVDWWWTKWSENAFGDEWIDIDIMINKASWWVEEEPRINKIQPALHYQEWILEEINKMRKEEGFLYDEMCAELERRNEEENFYNYGI
jgi:hypothetical protein